jgi:NAD(P)-dependent dehydrogenase (short-subunit alcohol dehydrogenase family)
VSDPEKTKFKKNVLISGGSRGIGKSAAYLLSRSDYQVFAPSSQELDQSSEKSVQDYFSNAEIEDCEQYLEGTAHNRTSSRLRRTNDRSVPSVHEDHEDDENAEIEDCEQSLLASTKGLHIESFGIRESYHFDMILGFQMI